MKLKPEPKTINVKRVNISLTPEGHEMGKRTAKKISRGQFSGLVETLVRREAKRLGLTSKKAA